VTAREHPPVLVEVGPVRVCLAGDDAAALGQGVQNRTQIELQSPQVVARADGEVFVVDEQGDAFFFGFHRPSLIPPRADAAQVGGQMAPPGGQVSSPAGPMPGGKHWNSKCMPSGRSQLPPR